MRRNCAGRWYRQATLVTVLIVGAVLAVPAAAAPTGPVSGTPAVGTPVLANLGSQTQKVRQLVQCGGTMYAVGSFTSIKKGSTVYTRDNAFSFSATSPYTVSSWDPDVNGTVNSIAFSPDCSTAYIGGLFTSIGGTTVKNIAEMSTSTGAVVSTFGHTAGGQVETPARGERAPAHRWLLQDHQREHNPYMASLDPATGKDDGFVQLNISGNYSSRAEQRHPGVQPGAQPQRDAGPGDG